MGKRKYGKYNKFDVVYADFGRNPHGIQGGIRVVDIGTAEWGRLVKSIYGRERKNAYNYYQDKQ